MHIDRSLKVRKICLSRPTVSSLGCLDVLYALVMVYKLRPTIRSGHIYCSRETSAYHILDS